MFNNIDEYFEECRGIIQQKGSASMQTSLADLDKLINEVQSLRDYLNDKMAGTNSFVL